MEKGIKSTGLLGEKKEGEERQEEVGNGVVSPYEFIDPSEFL